MSSEDVNSIEDGFSKLMQYTQERDIIDPHPNQRQNNMTTSIPESFFSFTVHDLFMMGVLKDTEVVRLNKKHIRLNKKRNKDLRQSDVNDAVEKHLETLEPGKLFKHRTVWEALGRDDFTRDEILTALQAHKENSLCAQVRKGDNNFQVFWTRALNEEPGE
jgi:hypothetical protein